MQWMCVVERGMTSLLVHICIDCKASVAVVVATPTYTTVTGMTRQWRTIVETDNIIFWKVFTSAAGFKWCICIMHVSIYNPLIRQTYIALYLSTPSQQTQHSQNIWLYVIFQKRILMLLRLPAIISKLNQPRTRWLNPHTHSDRHIWVYCHRFPSKWDYRIHVLWFCSGISACLVDIDFEQLYSITIPLPIWIICHFRVLDSDVPARGFSVRRCLDDGIDALCTV